VPEDVDLEEEGITEPMVAVHMEAAALVEAETGRCPMEVPPMVAEAEAMAAIVEVDGGNPI